MQFLRTAIRLMLVLATVGGGFAGFLSAEDALLKGSYVKTAIGLLWLALLLFSGISIAGLIFVTTSRVGRFMTLALSTMIPWLDLPGFKYQLTTVMYMTITFGPPNQLFGWSASLGSGFEIRLGGSPSGYSSFGINLFAVLLLLLASAYKRLPPALPSGATTTA